MTSVEDSEIHRTWTRMVQWLHDRAPVNAAALGPAATAEDVGAAEQAIGVPFPAALRTWLMLNNGVRAPDSRPDRAPVHDGCFLPGGQHPLSTASIPHVHRRLTALPPGGNPRRSSWNPRWIPFAADDYSYSPFIHNGDSYGSFIDTGDGTIGEWGDYGYLTTGVFPSLAAFFAYALTALRTSPTQTSR
ncbi:SMI1/KNR4 family protein [Streptomyces sp. CH-036]|uniref:SMI1/KNR4 family protein n=1 Tax=Streptomyces sp. CH-036 TaxID=3406733 RepID=UPI003C754671